MTQFATIEALRTACHALPMGDENAARQAAERQNVLTKPPGSLGRLEEAVIHLAHWQGRARPVLDNVHVLVFAGAHGVTARGVSAFPAEVTAQMVANFTAGGAAINQLALQAGATLTVTPLEIERPTADFTKEPAMSEAEFLAALQTGHDAVPANAELVVLGEMGIGNTTAAAAVAAALFGGKGADWVGRGTGVDDAGLKRKAETVDAALTRHGTLIADPLQALRVLGGRELAAMFGAALAARQRRTPVLLDGFVCGAAVAPLARLNDAGLAHTLAGHVSAEPGHRKLLAALDLRPLLDLDMRLGEASGACLAINVLRGAMVCHNGMATFAEAGVSDA